MRLHVVFLTLILLAVLGTYYLAVHGPYQFDDDLTIVQNHNLRSGQYGRIIGHTRARPFLMLSLYASYRMAGGDQAGITPPPDAFHWGNIVIHLLATALVYLVVNQAVGLLSQDWQQARSRWAVPVLTALLFGLHPLQTSAVTYISSRSSSQCTLFILASLFCYIRFRARHSAVEKSSERLRFWSFVPYATVAGVVGLLLVVFHESVDPQRHLITGLIFPFSRPLFAWFDPGSVSASGFATPLDLFRFLGWALLALCAATWILVFLWRADRPSNANSSAFSHAWFFGHVFCLVLAMGTKELAIVAPLLIVAFDRLILNRKFPTRGLAAKWSYVPMLGMALAAVVAWLIVFSGHTEATIYSYGEYARSQGVVLWKYVGLFLFPLGQSLDHTVFVPKWLPSVGEWAIGYGAILLVLVMAVLARKRWPAISLCAIWFFVGAAPTSWFKPFSDPMFEHRAYLLMPAMAALFAMGFVYLFRLVLAGRPDFFLRVIGFATGVAILLCFGALTLRQNNLYNTHTAMWRNVLEGNPTSPRAVQGMGYGLLKAADEQMLRPVRGIRALMVDKDLMNRPKGWESLGSAVRFTGDGLRHAGTLFQAAYHLEPDVVKLQGHANNIAIWNLQQFDFDIVKTQYDITNFRLRTEAKMRKNNRKTRSAEDLTKQQRKELDELVKQEGKRLEEQMDARQEERLKQAYAYWGRALGIHDVGIHPESAYNLGAFLDKEGKALYDTIEDDLAGPSPGKETLADAKRAEDLFQIAADLQQDTWLVEPGRTKLFPALARCYYHLGALLTTRRKVTKENQLRAYSYFHHALDVFKAYIPRTTLVEDREVAMKIRKQLVELEDVLPRGKYAHRLIVMPTWMARDARLLAPRRHGEDQNSVKDKPAPPRQPDRSWPGAGRPVNRTAVQRALASHAMLLEKVAKVDSKRLPGTLRAELDRLKSDKGFLEKTLANKPIGKLLAYQVLGRFHYALARSYHLWPERKMEDSRAAYTHYGLALALYSLVERSEAAKMPEPGKSEELKRVRAIPGYMSELESDPIGLPPTSKTLPAWARPPAPAEDVSN